MNILSVAKELKVEINEEMILICKEIDIAVSENNFDKASKFREALGRIVFDKMEKLL